MTYINLFILILYIVIFSFLQVIAYAAISCGKLPSLRQKTAGFVDTLPLFRQGCPARLDSYKQEALCHHFFCEAFAAHNALADAEALKKLVEQVQFAQELLVKHSFTLEFVLELQRFSAAKKSMMTSWENLVFCLNQWLKKLLVLA